MRTGTRGAGSSLLIEEVVLHTMQADAKGCIPRGYLMVEEGKITALGEGKAPSQLREKAKEVIYQPGAELSPGLIDGHCHLGLHNEGLRWEGMDYNEFARPITAGLRAIDSIYFHDPSFAQAAKAGVTTAFTGPGSGNVVGGEFAYIYTQGNSVEEQLIPDCRALKCAFGENPKGCYGQSGKAPYTRMGTAYLFREYFYRVKDYGEKRRLEGEKRASFDLDLEVGLEALEGKIPLKIHAHRADDILTAIRLCEEFGVRYTLDHCSEGMYVADELVAAYHSNKAKLEGIFLGPLFHSRSKPELARTNSGENVRCLMEKGLPVALVTDHPVVMLYLLSVSAALCCRAGISKEQALAAITRVPAEIMGQGAYRGTLEVGKQADLALFSGHPLAFDSRCLLTLCGGVKAYQAEELCRG